MFHMSSGGSVSPRRQSVANLLGLVVALCTMGWFLSIALTVFAVMTVDSGVPFFPGIIEASGLVVTLPPALLCTGAAMALVGAKRSRLAWISLCIYALPLVWVIAVIIFRSV